MRCAYTCTSGKVSIDLSNCKDKFLLKRYIFFSNGIKLVVFYNKYCINIKTIQKKVYCITQRK